MRRSSLLFVLMAATVAAGGLWADDEPIVCRPLPVSGTGNDFMQLVSFRDPEILDRVNKRIEKLTRTFGCKSSGGTANGRPTYFDVNSRVSCAAQDVLSIAAAVSYFCGGTSPSREDVSLTFDLT